MHAPSPKDCISVIELLFLLTLGLIFLTPVVFSTSIAKGILSFKFFYLFYLSCCCAFFCVIQLIKNRAANYTGFTITDYLVIIFFVYLLINTQFVADQLHAGNDKADKLIIFISSIVTYVGIRIFFRPGLFEKLFFKGAFLLMLNIAIFECLFALLQQFRIFPGFNEGADLPVTGTFTHPAMLGGFLAILAPFLFAQSGMVKRLSALLPALLILLALIITKSRAALVAGIIAILYVKFLPNLLSFLKRNKALVIAALAGIGLLTYGLIQIRTASVFGRMVVWKISCTMIADAPVFGHGLGAFRDIYPGYQIRYFANSTSDFEKGLADFVSFSFNEFLQLWLELGIVGLIILAAITCSPFLNRAQSPEVKGAKGSILAFAAFCFFSYPFSLNYMVLYLFIFLGIAGMPTSDKKIGKLLVGIPLFIILLSPFYFANMVYHKLIAYKNLVIAQKTADPGNAIAIYEQQFNVLRNDGYYLSIFAEHLIRADRPALALKILGNKKGLTYADRLMMGDLYVEVGKKDSALKCYIDAGNLLPNETLPREKIADLTRSSK